MRDNSNNKNRYEKCFENQPDFKSELFKKTEDVLQTTEYTYLSKKD